MSGKYLYKPAELVCKDIPEADSPGALWQCDCSQIWFTDMDKDEPYWRRISGFDASIILQNVKQGKRPFQR